MTVPRLSAALTDRYRIERELGQGGMATVYLAQDLRHDRKVALKVLRPDLAAVIGADRFLQEIRTTANLQHPHILPLHDSGQVDGTVFYVMPFVDGESLRDRLLRDKQLPLDEAVRVGREVADALGYAHEHGIIHRDIKPENILLQRGHALVADFGIALAASKTGGSRMTETGMSLGTPHYMSPEQAMGDRDLGPRSDVYALGCVCYEMLCGEPPFTGPTPQAIVARVMTEAPRPIRSQRQTVPEHVEAAVLQALEKLPADRFATASEFAAALSGATAVRTAARPASAAARPGLWRPLAVAASAVAVAAVAFARVSGRQDPAPGTVRLSVAFPAGQQILPGVTHRFELSRNGARMVYVGPDSAGGTQLWIRELNSLIGRPLPGTSGGQAPFFSPAGDSVAFFIGNPGSLKAVSVAGGAPRTLVQDSVLPWGGDWSSDGTFYFGHASGRLARVRPGTNRVDVFGQVQDTTGVTEQDWPQALPGGKYLLAQLWRNSVANSQIGLIDLASGTIKPILQAFSARYVPSGHLVYATVDGMLHRVPFDPRSGSVKGSPVTIAERVQMDIESGSSQFSVSDNGVLVYSAGGSDASGRVVWVDRQGRQTPVDTSWRGQFGGLALSPDDTRLAVSIQGEPGQQIWIKELPAGPLSRVTLSGFTNDRPGWTPDGLRLTYQSANRVAMIQRADGSAAAETLAVSPLAVEQIDFLPDGKRYVLRVGAAAGRRDLYLGTLGDTTKRPLVVSPADEFAPAVSPDGRWFAYTSSESGRNEVFVRSLDNPGAGRTQVSTGGGRESRWARSGGELFYRTDAGEMMAVEVTPGTPFRARPPRRLFVAPGMAGDTYHHVYVVARDGRFLMVNQSTVSGDLVVVLNWQAELQSRR